ncbi:hypothetical protein ABT270_04590 [Streptomyces sp900105245]|uniref:hypothetical protein n=1 Tax=Streptomyces sp. 900105245 TaxID=3154379 RepID=UPI0033296C94
MKAETLAALFGFGGAVLGALIGGGTSLLSAKLTLGHQRSMVREDRLRELGEAAAEAGLSHCDQILDLCSSLTGRELGAPMDRYDLPWGAATREHLSSITMCARRIPNRDVHDRVMMLVRLGGKWRCAGNSYLRGAMFMTDAVHEIAEALTAYLRDDDLPPLEDITKENQGKAEAYVYRPGVVRPMLPPEGEAGAVRS